MLSQQQQLGEMRLLAYNDYLTGLPNRRHFERQLDAEWDAAVQNGHSIGILFIDVDHFKAFNDLAGHDKGDDCLVAISKRLQKSISNASWTLARFGGEEFCVLVPQCDENEVAQTAEQVRLSVWEANIEHPKPQLDRVTVSVGAASVAPTENDDMRNLLRLADQALYQAKAAGRNQCILSLPEDS